MNATVAVEKKATPDRETRLVEANQIVRNYALASIVPSLLPVPMLDLGLVTAVQLKMLHSLANTYDIKFKDELGRSSIAALVGGTASLSMARVVSSAVKAFPGVGSIVGAVTMPTINGGLTFAIGKMFVQHFESGGTFLDFDPTKVRAYFEKEFAEGKELVAAAQTSGEVAKDGTTKSKTA